MFASQNGFSAVVDLLIEALAIVDAKANVHPTPSSHHHHDKLPVWGRPKQGTSMLLKSDDSMEYAIF
jgi:hypothetical protein